MLNERFVLVGAGLNVLGTGSYAWATLQGRTRPNRVTWALWALVPWIAFAAELGQGVGLPAVMTFTVGLGPAAVVLASVLNRQAYWSITRLDIACGMLSLVALGLWAATRTGNVAIALSIGADALAGGPTLVKAYRHPATERARAFALGATSAAITLLTIRAPTFESIAFPAYVMLICLVLTALIMRPGGSVSRTKPGRTIMHT